MAGASSVELLSAVPSTEADWKTALPWSLAPCASLSARAP